VVSFGITISTYGEIEGMSFQTTVGGAGPVLPMQKDRQRIKYG
jgi:hypothetical protein